MPLPALVVGASLRIDVRQHGDITDRQDHGTWNSVAEHDDSATVPNH